MRAGAAQVCITPPVGADLCGFVAREQPSTGFRDDLYVRAVYLEQGGERLLWVHADLIGFMREWLAPLGATLGAELGLQQRQMLFSATHTHSGPATVALRECGRLDERYLGYLAARMQEAARRAVAHPEPVTLRSAEGRCGLGRDRRKPGSNAHADPALPVLMFERPDGSPLAILANYAMHNVGFGHENRRISADIAGAAARWIGSQFPGEPVVLVTNGGCGNVNPPAYSNDAACVDGWGQELGEAVLSAVRDGGSRAAPQIASARETLALPLAVLSADAVQAEFERVRRGVRADTPIGARVLRAAAAWRESALAQLASGGPAPIPVDLQVVRIGPAAFVAVGAEVFSRLAVDLRATRGPHVYVVGYAHGVFGYLPPREVHAEGGYEITDAHRYYPANFPVAPGAFELVREQALALLAASARRPY